MHTLPCRRSRLLLLAVSGAYVALLSWLPAVSAQIPGFPPPACPPNTSCVPGIPPITPPTPPGTCGPGNGGDTCGGTGPASAASPHGINLGAGNPINIITGNKYQREVDMAALPGQLGLEIVRHYNSAFSGAGGSTNLMGRGWKLSYETELYVRGATVQIVQADGARVIFNRDPANPSQCSSANPADGTLTVSKGKDGEQFVWRWNTGRELSFDSRGKLTQILAPGGQFVSLQHDARGLLVRVTDPQGRSLHLSYPDQRGAAYRGVQRIDSPVGTFSYSYGSALPKGATEPASSVRANLVKVAFPSGARYYHYENPQFPTLLTGISELALDSAGKAAWQRVSTYGYDSNGKGNLSVKGYPARLARGADGALLAPPVLAPGTGREQVTLDTSVGGQTTVTNSVGQKTVYKHAVVGGQFRFLEVRGAGCSNCGEVNVRYGYDKLGRLTEVTTLDAAGAPLATSQTELDALGRTLLVSKIIYQNGKPGLRLWQARYAYEANAVQPVLVARPSVVPGKELVTRISYDDRGLPLTVSESGFAPGVDGQGAPMAIERTVRYRYNVYGERIETAGALPEGASGAGLSRIEVDPRTKLPRRTESPGKVVTEVVERDAALRPRVLQSSDGATVRNTTISYNWRGQPEQIRTDAGPVTRIERWRYDLNGRLLAHVRPDGGAAPLAPAAPDPEQLAGLPAQRDWAQRPVAWQDELGVIALQATWGAPGTAAQGSILALASAGGKAERLVDDFGRVCAIRNPGQGWQLARYDSAGRLLEIRDARGARQLARYDAAGRLLQLQRFVAGASAPEQTVTYRYAGMQVAEQSLTDADGTRQTVSEYDQGGQLVRETLRIAPAGALAAAMPRAVTLSQSWRYDGAGAVVAHTITDAAGTTTALTQTVDARGMPVRLSTAGALPAFLGGERDIVRAVDWRDLGGARFAAAITHGDGSTDTFALAPPPSLRSSQPPAQARTDGAQLPGSPGRDSDQAGLPAAIDTALPQRLRWNAAGQLVQTARAGGSSDYLYDARGQRVVKLVREAGQAPRVTLSLYDGTRLMAEADAGGVAEYAYAYLGYRPLAQLDLRRQSWWGALRRTLFGAPLRELHTDRVGKVLSMTAGGVTVWQESGPRAAGIHQPLRYVGQYHDDESALAYHGARWFDPASGRFLSPDPAGVADAVSEVPVALLLDLYAYAGGRPDEFFDPDGAARVRYFLVTDTAGKARGDGFVNARWAFIVDNVKSGGDASAAGQKRNEYAANGTGALVDVKGTFLGGKESASTWQGASDVADKFAKHYGDNLVSMTQFTVDMDDDDATALIASYIPADKQALFGKTCPARALLMPDIRFAAEEVPIKVTAASYKDGDGKVLAQSQRIVACGKDAENDQVARRLNKYNYAAMLLESAPSQIYKDCSSNGCPGLSLKNTVLSAHVASYGQTQFIGTTMVSTLLSLKSGKSLDAAGRTALALDDAALWTKVNLQQKRATYMSAHWKDFKPKTPAWDAATAKEQASFKAGTGLDDAAAKALWNDIVAWAKKPDASFNGEARAAVSTTVLMSDPAVKKYLMDIFKDSAAGGKFSVVSLALMRISYDDVKGKVDQTNSFPPTVDGKPNPAWVKRQRQIEIELGVRTGRAHNGDWDQSAKTGTFVEVVAADANEKKGRQYGHRLMNAYEYPVIQPKDDKKRQPTGDYFSFRCTAELPGNIPRGGLQITPLNLQ